MSLHASKATSSRFTPGRGLIPPYLAGREYEQRLLNRQHDLVAAGERVPADVVLVGPRGNGKTALLRWFENTVRERGEADVVWVTPTRIPSVAEMAKVFVPSAIAGKGTLRASLGVLSGEWTLDGERHGDLVSLLIARCRRRPLIVLLDEAHTLDLEVGQALLNASQEVGSRAPFLLCLAGTPGLTNHLSRMGASFVGRSRELRIRLLERTAAAAALVEPLKASGIAIEPEALAAVIDESQRYPYFVQVWGDALLEAATADGAAAITPKTIEAARPEFEGVRERFYLERYDELEQADLLPAAAAVAEAFRQSAAPVLSRGAIDRALKEAGAGLVERQALNARGFIWRSLDPAYKTAHGTLNVFEPGIPSLMAHVRDEATRSAATD